MKREGSIRVQNLKKILLSKYIPAEQLNREFNSNELKGIPLGKTLAETYKELGGMAEFPEARFKVPFLEFGRFCVLLDEAAHFNRYRAKTLRSSFYQDLQSFPAMKQRTYCRKYEIECLKVATSNPLWTNKEAEAHFGKSQSHGDLGLQGSSGWKWTALKDLMIDLIARERKIRLLRLSVWDDLMAKRKLVKLNALLMSPGRDDEAQILSYVEKRIVALYADDF